MTETIALRGPSAFGGVSFSSFYASTLADTNMFISDHIDHLEAL
ncbi:uncharacterized protein FIBRA_03119 [Fibroporia radiculosa]|uniref:Uncharacterized protein n=1 Tax=Fibroporia radiculosa TaxID=599839 RepID=J4I9F5_9APHY|nr:uncharacterized protein FIBRA_03119 [Fibroporia radiculosa]CCM01071.1 predicted protein [Fibroporia radiculosa]